MRVQTEFPLDPARADTAGRASIVYTPLDSLDALPRKRGAFEVKVEGLNFRFRLFPVRRPSRLVVLLNAVWGPGGGELKWPRYAQAFGSSMVLINDPTLQLRKGMRVSCFLGTERLDPIAGVTTIAARAAAVLGVDQERIVYVGNSGSGFGAIMAAARTGSAAIATNPQLDLARAARTPTSARIMTVFAKGESLPDLCARHPERSSVGAALQEAAEAGRNPRIFIAQNVRDVFHHTTHFRPFIASFAEPGMAPIAKLVRAVTFDETTGHGTPKRETLRRLSKLALEAASDQAAFRSVPFLSDMRAENK